MQPTQLSWQGPLTCPLVSLTVSYTNKPLPFLSLCLLLGSFCTEDPTLD